MWRGACFGCAVGLLISCGGKVTYVDDGDGNGGEAAVSSGSSNTPSTTGGTGGVGNSGGLGTGGFVEPQSELCDTACGNISFCLDLPAECASRCAQYRELSGCEEIADEYLACVLQDQFDSCTFDGGCSQIGFLYLDCQGDLPQDGGCAFDDDGSCFCDTFTTQGHIISSGCGDGMCDCFNDDEYIGSCDNSLIESCDPLFNCCSSLNLVVGFELPSPG